jgi:hypothetical protein
MLAKVFEICNLTVLSVSVRNLHVFIVVMLADVLDSLAGSTVVEARRKPLQRVYNYLVTKSHNL